VNYIIFVGKSEVKRPLKNPSVDGRIVNANLSLSLISKDKEIKVHWVNQL
jgi:hypothetical protein